MMLGLGAVLAWYLFDYNLWWRKIKFDSSWLVIGFIILSLVGARLLHVGLHWGYYQNNLLEIHQFWQGGMASYGVVIGLGYVIFVLRKEEFFQDILDAAVPSLFLALFVARTGCFLINDHFGKLTDWPWGIDSLGDGLRHPISMYYFILAGVSFLVFSHLFYREKFRGRLMWLMLIFYPLYRLVIDLMFKDFQADNISYFATITVSVLLMIIAIWQFMVLKYKE